MDDGGFRRAPVAGGAAESVPVGGDGIDVMAAIAKLTEMVEELQRASVSARPGDIGLPEIMRRIERLESWVISNRQP